jgi:hypothetical protein
MHVFVWCLVSFHQDEFLRTPDQHMPQEAVGLGSAQENTAKKLID